METQFSSLRNGGFQNCLSYRALALASNNENTDQMELSRRGSRKDVCLPLAKARRSWWPPGAKAAFLIPVHFL